MTFVSRAFYALSIVLMMSWERVVLVSLGAKLESFVVIVSGGH
ncbi:hypothetical protein VCR4J2_250001 [Vibrio coralliirubri]|nr:hypothetical protein [Vibrio coralliirubri]CDT07281.1 hypothetical protein VCR4J2_250001 [Vibrio coralliirubri]